ncbi:MAG: hypothetical protein ACREGR_00335, partial [Minisyncoccia bacterium]
MKEAISVPAMTRNELSSDYIRTVKLAVRKALGQVGGLNQRFIEILATYFSWLYGKEMVPAEEADAKFHLDWEALGAYLTAYANDATLRSRLTSTSYDRVSIQADSARYHRQLTFKDRKYDKGPAGLVLVEVDKEIYKLFSRHPEIILALPKGDQRYWAYDLWTGWTWQSLGCGYSREEGSAAGHCGNASRKKGDNILSLRDADDKVHLTFIVNGGALGEMKAVGNTKPASIYHPAIIALLDSPYVNKVSGGGYMEEVNFDLGDLANDQLRELAQKLMDKPEAKTAENVRPPEYLGQFTQEVVDNASAEEKKRILAETLNIFSDLNHNESAAPVFAHVHFDLRKLVLEVLD